jgi:hypothetical protein
MTGLPTHIGDAPAVLGACVSISRATARHGPLDQRARGALMFVAAAAGAYALAIISALALRSGWRQDQVRSLLAGHAVGEGKPCGLPGVAREAAASSGRVSDTTWQAATGHGWGDEQLTEAFAYLGLTVFTSYSVSYAATELDVPALAAPASEGA